MKGERWREAAEQLAAWFEVHRRPMPWRGTRDPYGIWVSEVMLQQTRVATVLDKWPRFLRRFPTPGDLAAASDDELLSAWAGLGYYRRARQLRAAMQSVLAEHGGEIPREPEDFGALPGVGPYTRGAVLSIAHDAPLPAIDGNVERVLSRFDLVEGDPKKPATHRGFAKRIAYMHEAAAPSILNQALMELGATLCSKTRPSCLSCPIQKNCAARLAGRSEELPQKKPKPKPTVLSVQLLWAQDGKRVLARRVPKGEVNEGQLCLPGPGLPRPKYPSLKEALRQEHRLHAPKLGPSLGSIRHGITRYRLEIELCAPAMPKAKLDRALGLSWQRQDDPALPWSTVARKAFKLMAKQGKVAAE
ncbi:MAG: A/G-specific adenine glycosylase [Planctomycetota bacterium]|nr:MAG: A/G-specific adenine glycosylase [Planctomycetota bacterium]